MSLCNVKVGSYDVRANTFCAFNTDHELTPFTQIDTTYNETVILSEVKECIFPIGCCIYYLTDDVNSGQSNSSGTGARSDEFLGRLKLKSAYHCADLREDGMNIGGTASLRASAFNPQNGLGEYIGSHRVFMRVLVDDGGFWYPDDSVDKLIYSDSELAENNYYIYLGMHNGVSQSTNWYSI